MMSFSKMQWQDSVRRCKAIPVAQRLVIAHIGATADPQGLNAWRANDRVVNELGVSPDTVKRARAAAVRHGFMVATRPAPRGAGNSKTTEYQLLMPVDNSVNRCSSAPISGEEIGAADGINRCSSAQLIGAAECPPSVNASVNSSGESARAREDDEPLDVQAVPDPGNALSPQDHLHLHKTNIIAAELVDELDDPEPPDYCDAHMPHGAWNYCRDCAIVVESPRNAMAGSAIPAHSRPHSLKTQSPIPKPGTSWPLCNYCRDTGIVLNSDGTPGSQPRICHCDGSFKPMTDAEQTDLAELLEHLNRGAA